MYELQQVRRGFNLHFKEFIKFIQRILRGPCSPLLGITKLKNHLPQILKDWCGKMSVEPSTLSNQVK